MFIISEYFVWNTFVPELSVQSSPGECASAWMCTPSVACSRVSVEGCHLGSGTNCQKV